MAAEIKKEFEVETQLVRLSGGIFDVKVGDALVYSKSKTGRFPEPGEVGRLIREQALV